MGTGMSGEGGGGGAGDAGWYDLFSRGARDWLRHNDKVRDAVRQQLPQIVAGADVLTGGASTVRVPVKMLEHYRFKLRPPSEQEGVGQGQAKPGDRIGRPQQEGDQRGQGGNEDGGIQYTLEFRIDDIVDWLWEEMQLPNLEAKAGKSRDDDWTREAGIAVAHGPAWIGGVHSKNRSSGVACSPRKAPTRPPSPMMTCASGN